MISSRTRPVIPSSVVLVGDQSLYTNVKNTKRMKYGVLYRYVQVVLAHFDMTASTYRLIHTKSFDQMILDTETIRDNHGPRTSFKAATLAAASPPISKPSRASISSGVSSKSKMSTFDLILSSVLDAGIGISLYTG